VKIDLKKEISLPKLRKPSLPSAPKLSRKGGEEKPSRASLGGPDLHAPKFLADLYADLRDKRLLPLVVLLVAAMIAAPILLPTSGESDEPAAAVPVAGGEGEAKDATLTVVPAETGLHDYKKRLGHRAPLNPFRQAPGEAASARKEGSGTEGGSSSGGSEGGAPESPAVTSYEETVTTTVGGVTTEVPASAAEPSPVEQPRESHHKSSKSESKGSESATGPTETVESTPPAAPVETTEPTTPAVPTTPSTPTPVEPTHTESTATETSEASTKESSKTDTATEVDVPQPIVGYAIDAEAGFVPHTTEKTELAPMTKLPNAKHPLVLYMGLSKNHKRALFLMTSNVTAYYGGHCALDKSSCQLVEVQAGKGITFADGYGESRYKVHLKRIVPLRFSK
jgi:hypothetical protein